MARLTLADLADLNAQFESSDPSDLIRWAKGHFGDRLAALSSMQKAGCVVCHMLGELKLEIPVLFVDTGVLFPESYEHRDRIAAEYGLTVHSLTPKQTMAEQTE
ncbi:MAG: phosphoadenosine phosphosulfate reductase family protein, partial [Planctomycetota bacterium]